jgi:hypothetical protein
MASVARIQWGRVVLRAIVAGIVGGVCTEVFLYLATMLPHNVSILTVWQSIASTAFGKRALTSATYAWAGLVMYFAVSIGWAVGYGYLAVTQRGITTRPAISGLVFGFVVWGVMQLVLYTVQALTIHSFGDAAIEIVGAMVFFGLPVALVTSSQMRAHYS